MLPNDVFVMQHEHSSGGVFIYPDGKERGMSDFPLCGVSLYYSYKKHFILANEHKERWVLSDVESVTINLEYFSPEWRDCWLNLVRGQTDFSRQLSDEV